MLNRLTFGIALAAVAGSAVATDFSTINSFKSEERIFNDFPTSSLVSTNAFPSLVYDEDFAAGTIGNFANKHVGYLSNDGGATRFQNNYWQSWALDFTVKIEAPAGQPRKEAGIEVRNPRPRLGYTDEGQVLIASDGEVAVFGGVMPFTGLGNVYTLGTTASVKFEYFAPGTVDAVVGAYRLTFTDAVTGVHSSGLKLWGLESDGLYGFNDGAEFGLKAQNTRNPFIDDSSTITYGGVTVIPAPGTLALLGIAGVAAGRRRR
jgi:hypothetical protein